MCVSVCLSVLCSLCKPTVLSESARNLARGILISYRWSWGLASAARARGLALTRPNWQAKRRRVNSVGKFETSGQQLLRNERRKREM